MSRRRILVPEAKGKLDKFKIETAKELSEYNKNHEEKQLNVGGHMVKKMVEDYEKKLK